MDEKGEKKITDAIQFIDSVVPFLKQTDVDLKQIYQDSPIGTYNIDKGLYHQRQTLIQFAINRIQEEYPFLKLNDKLIIKFSNVLMPFDMDTIRDFVSVEYQDIEKITLRQLQYIILKEMLPYEAKSKDDIKNIRNTGIDIKVSNSGRRDQVNAFSRFCQVVLTGIKPTDTVDIEDYLDGVLFSTPEIKSLKTHDNGAFKVYFRSEFDRERFKIAIFKSAEELLGRCDKIKTELGPCDTCLMWMLKSSCNTCTNFSNWVGHCSFCFYNCGGIDDGGSCSKCKTRMYECFTITRLSLSNIQITIRPELSALAESKSRERLRYG